MKKSRIFDCITFFDNNLMFEIRYNILFNVVDYFVICESEYDHRGIKKKPKFIWKDCYKSDKIKYFLQTDPFPKNSNRWENQALQREYLLKSLSFAEEED